MPGLHVERVGRIVVVFTADAKVAAIAFITGDDAQRGATLDTYIPGHEPFELAGQEAL